MMIFTPTSDNKGLEYSLKAVCGYKKDGTRTIKLSELPSSDLEKDGSPAIYPNPIPIGVGVGFLLL